MKPKKVNMPKEVVGEMLKIMKPERNNRRVSNYGFNHPCTAEQFVRLTMLTAKEKEGLPTLAKEA